MFRDWTLPFRMVHRDAKFNLTTRRRAREATTWMVILDRVFFLITFCNHSTGTPPCLPIFKSATFFAYGS